MGRGAFGRVFEATEQALGGRPVVLKVVVQGRQEAEKLARLRHPNIVPVHSVCQEDMTGLAAICMPFLGQATLSVVRDALFAQGRVPMQARAIWEAIQAANADHEMPEPVTPPRILLAGSYVEGVIYLAAEMAEGLAHAHHCGLSHRDLKPSNILLSPSARPLLLDFDLAVDEQRPVAVGGTLPYMAPEELNRLGGEPAGIRSQPYDPSSDIFSLGVVVYELLTGTLPFGPVFRDDSVRDSVPRLAAAASPRPPSHPPAKSTGRPAAGGLDRKVPGAESGRSSEGGRGTGCRLATRVWLSRGGCGVGQRRTAGAWRQPLPSWRHCSSPEPPPWPSVRPTPSDSSVAAWRISNRAGMTWQSNA